MIIVTFQIVTQKIIEGVTFELNISDTIKKCQLPVSFSCGLVIEMFSERGNIMFSELLLHDS